jgi:hypothetical protein
MIESQPGKIPPTVVSPEVTAVNADIERAINYEIGGYFLKYGSVISAALSFNEFYSTYNLIRVVENPGIDSISSSLVLATVLSLSVEGIIVGSGIKDQSRNHRKRLKEEKKKLLQEPTPLPIPVFDAAVAEKDAMRSEYV